MKVLTNEEISKMIYFIADDKNYTPTPPYGFALNTHDLRNMLEEAKGIKTFKIEEIREILNRFLMRDILIDEIISEFEEEGEK